MDCLFIYKTDHLNRHLVKLFSRIFKNSLLPITFSNILKASKPLKNLDAAHIILQSIYIPTKIRWSCITSLLLIQNVSLVVSQTFRNSEVKYIFQLYCQFLLLRKLLCTVYFFYVYCKIKTNFFIQSYLVFVFYQKINLL